MINRINTKKCKKWAKLIKLHYERSSENKVKPCSDKRVETRSTTLKKIISKTDEIDNIQK